MRIDHIAIWADDIELLRAFYTRYFNLTSGALYTNPTKRFTSCFLSFGDGGARIELMHIPGLLHQEKNGTMKGLAHFAVSVGDRQTVDALTERLRSDGYTVLGEPRTTGDGYYESVIADPEGNRIEITI